uniref:Uncharacterized protein n=1 Tax=Caenorhabditis japonica TaxID=281687 RepID=A0A8R1ESI7_CAEJA
MFFWLNLHDDDDDGANKERTVDNTMTLAITIRSERKRREVESKFKTTLPKAYKRFTNFLIMFRNTTIHCCLSLPTQMLDV